jgi:hypothetical protein
MLGDGALQPASPPTFPNVRGKQRQESRLAAIDLLFDMFEPARVYREAEAVFAEWDIGVEVHPARTSTDDRSRS